MQNLAEDIGSLFLQHLCQRIVGRIDDGLRVRADFDQFTDQAVRLVQDPVGTRRSAWFRIRWASAIVLIW